MIPDIFPIIKNNNSVTALIGSNPVRFFPFGEAPQNVAYPYVTYAVINGIPANSLDCVPDIDNLPTQVDVWAKTAESAESVATAIRDAIEPTTSMTNIRNMGRDPDTKSYRITLEFDFWTYRND